MLRSHYSLSELLQYFVYSNSALRHVLEVSEPFKDIKTEQKYNYFALVLVNVVRIIKLLTNDLLPSISCHI